MIFVIVHGTLYYLIHHAVYKMVVFLSLYYVCIILWRDRIESESNFLCIEYT